MRLWELCFPGGRTLARGKSNVRLGYLFAAAAASDAGSVLPMEPEDGRADPLLAERGREIHARVVNRRREPEARAWDIVFYFGHDEALLASGDAIFDAAREHPDFLYACGQLEPNGPDAPVGRFHLQCFCEFKTKKRRSFFEELLPDLRPGWWSARPARYRAATRNYCLMPDKRVCLPDGSPDPDACFEVGEWDPVRQVGRNFIRIA